MASPYSFVLLGLAFLFGGVCAENPLRSYDWNVSYSVASPLGVQKTVIVINDQFPGPLLNATTNDLISVNVRNNLPEPLLFTWNGIQQRRNSWQDGTQETNCPIPPGTNWTYVFQMKDQIGSFFYYPTLELLKTAGGYGPIRVFNRDVIAVPFDRPFDEFDVLIGDWYNANHTELMSTLDHNGSLPNKPDGVLINGFGPYQTNFTFEPGATYRLRISNVGLKSSLNFRIQNHTLLLVETEGSYTAQHRYHSLDVHVGQSYSVLVTADQPNGAYHVVVGTRFLDQEVVGAATLHYSGSTPADDILRGPIPTGPHPRDYIYSIEQASSIRWNLSCGAARPNPQGSFHYGRINVTRFFLFENDKAVINGTRRYTVNGVSFTHPDTPLKLSDYFQIQGVYDNGSIPDVPDGRPPALGVSVLDGDYHDFVEIVFQNPEDEIQSWHTDGYNFFVVGMGAGKWDDSRRAIYNMVDAVWRSTTQVYPNSWTAVLLGLDNQGMWNFRSQMADRQYLGQEFYLRVGGRKKGGPPVSERDELLFPDNALLCGRAAGLQ